MNKIIAIILFLIVIIPISKGDGCLPVGYNKSLHTWGTSDGFPIIYIEPYDTNDQVKTMEYKDAVESALGKWVEASAAAFLVENKDSANVRVQWVENYTKLPPPYNKQNYVGVADKNNVWLVKNDSNDNTISFYEMDNVAMHEFGHVWGINHSNDENDVMYDVAGVPQYRGPSSRDKQALECSFKGFDVRLDYGLHDNNGLNLVYGITSKLGNLDNVEIKRYISPGGDITRDPITIKSLKLNVETTRNTGVTTDLSDATEITIGLWILKASLPNIKDAKFVSKKFENTSKINKEKKECMECHAWTMPLYDVKGNSLNIHGFIILTICLIIVGIFEIKRHEK